MANEPSRKYFTRGLTADRSIAPETGENVGGDRRDFQRDENQYQLDRGRHEAHADRAKQNQTVIFAARISCTSMYSYDVKNYNNGDGDHQ